MSEAGDEERRRDALYRALINAIQYTAKEWWLTQRDVFVALEDVRSHVADLFLRGNRDANRKPKQQDHDERDN